MPFGTLGESYDGIQLQLLVRVFEMLAKDRQASLSAVGSSIPLVAPHCHFHSSTMSNSISGPS